VEKVLSETEEATVKFAEEHPAYLGAREVKFLCRTIRELAANAERLQIKELNYQRLERQWQEEARARDLAVSERNALRRRAVEAESALARLAALATQNRG
jgi:hypothetical protein